jgi:hypothetical protein
MRRILFMLVFLLASTALYAEAPSDPSLPVDLSNITPEMRTAGFWIARHSYPDKLIMNPAQVAGLNARLVRQGLVLDLSVFPEKYDGTKLKAEISELYAPLRKRALYLKDKSEAGPMVFEPLEAAMHLEDIAASVEPRYGFIVARADERLAPMDIVLTAQPGDVDFDEAQNSGLDIATPVIVLHQTKDGAWLFVKDAIASGWVRAEKVALVSRDEFLSYVKRKDVVVTTAPQADIFLDRQLTKYYGTVKMGTRFVLKNDLGKAVEIVLLQKGSGFLASSEVNIGFLTFTPWVIYEQAFKMLDKPYGWGDMNGGQDCSRFIQMVFATVGLVMPRNSGEQRQVGILLDGFKEDLSAENKEAYLVGDGVGAITVLGLKGHIMLYLGEVDEKPYAIHATWSYKEKMPDGQGERPRLIQRVAVTGLDLGAGSAKGSLLERIISIRVIEK